MASFNNVSEISSYTLQIGRVFHILNQKKVNLIPIAVKSVMTGWSIVRTKHSFV